jgi:FAD:protein FMN transferase
MRARVPAALGLTACLCLPGCRERIEERAAGAPTVTPAPPEAPRPFAPARVDIVESAMGTEVHVVAYTTPTLDEAAVRLAGSAALAEIHRLEGLMSDWREETEVGRINARAGEPVPVSPETFEVFSRSRWMSERSEGAFDVSFNVLHDVWKFGDAAENPPRLPEARHVRQRRARIDYRKVRLDPEARTVTIDPGMRVGLGGIAKGYAVDRAARQLRERGVAAFLVQAGGDLYGAGRKPDGSPWVSGIQDPRGPRGTFFAALELTDAAFSTAGDYARSFVVGGKRYHHIIDPRTGYPATACRSVTVWAPDAFTADAVDDAVFILGPERGLELVASLPGVGAVIVDADNRVIVSPRLEGKVRIERPPTNGP